MEPYQTMYYRLFNRVTDAIALLRRMELVPAINLLMDAQQETEALFIESRESEESAEESAT